MKTYPYTTPEGIIELVEKSQYDELRLELARWQTLAEAVKRMEKLRFGEIEAAYWQSGLGLENVRALLISAAKGEQP